MEDNLLQITVKGAVGKADAVLIQRKGNHVPQTKIEADRTWKRLGSWREFERRFDPIMFHDGNEPWFMDNGIIWSYAYPITVPEQHVWTVCDIDGELLICEGFAFVDRFGYIICRNPRELPETRSAYKTYKY